MEQLNKENQYSFHPTISLLGYASIIFGCWQAIAQDNVILGMFSAFLAGGFLIPTLAVWQQTPNKVKEKQNLYMNASSIKILQSPVVANALLVLVIIVVMFLSVLGWR